MAAYRSWLTASLRRLRPDQSPTLFYVGLSVFFLFAGCSKFKDFVTSSNPYHTDGYEAVMEKWSREARIHRGLEVELIASATYKSEEFKRAYAREYAAAYRLPEEEKDRLFRTLLEADQGRHEFILAAYVPEKKWDQFDKVPSMWKLYLVNDNNERVGPLEIRRLESNDPLAHHFFPYVTPWKTVYSIVFPSHIAGSRQRIVCAGTKTIKLMITSVLGTTEMTWPVDGKVMGGDSADLPR